MTAKDDKLKAIFNELEDCLHLIRDEHLLEYLKEKGVPQNDVLFMIHESMSLITTCMMRIDYVDKKIT